MNRDPSGNGVSYERRLVLSLPLLFARSTLAPAPLPGGSFAQLTTTCNSLAQDLQEKKALTPDEYLSRLASLEAGLDPGDVPLGKLGRFSSFEPPIELGPIHLALPITVIQWRFAPGALLPPHNHTPAHVLSLCLEGECRVRHFDALGAPPLDSRDTFRVRETESRVLRAGRSTSLTPDRDNITRSRRDPRARSGSTSIRFFPARATGRCSSSRIGPSRPRAGFRGPLDRQARLTPRGHPDPVDGGVGREPQGCGDGQKRKNHRESAKHFLVSSCFRPPRNSGQRVRD